MKQLRFLPRWRASALAAAVALSAATASYAAGGGVIFERTHLTITATAPATPSATPRRDQCHSFGAPSQGASQASHGLDSSCFRVGISRRKRSRQVMFAEVLMAKVGR